MSKLRRIFITAAVIFGLSAGVWAQGTAFTFQGRLQVSSSPATGTYEMEFVLYDAVAGGSQVGSTVSIPAVEVSGGTFRVVLDFGSAFASGDPRFLEIRVKQTGAGAFETLSPRQSVGSSPFAMRSTSALTADNALTALNADKLGGVNADQFVVTTDPRMSDARPPTAFSENYIHNSSLLQPFANFKISGTGSASILSAWDQIVLNGSTFLRGTSTSAFIGPLAGPTDIVSQALSSNTVVGGVAGGTLNSGTVQNSFFGRFTGSGLFGSNNSAFGYGAAESMAGSGGSRNSYFGSLSGANQFSTSGSDFTLLGFSSRVNALGIQNATAIGSRSEVSQSNSLVLGSISGVNGATASTNVGIGTTAPRTRLDVNGAVFISGPRTVTPVGDTMSLSSESTFDAIQSFNNKPLALNPAGNNVGIGENAPETRLHVSSNSNTQFMLEVTGGRKWVIGNMSGNNGNFEIRDHTGTQTSRFTITADGNIGARTQGPTDRLDVNGTLRVRTLGSAGSESICRNASGQISTCSSSLRYKENTLPFSGGIEIIRHLNPITFNWKGGGALDLGLGAEEVAAVDPLLVNCNENGEVEGVKYDRIGVVLVNAVREQQDQIRSQENEIGQLKRQLELQRNAIAELKALICALTLNAAVCSVPDAGDGAKKDDQR